MAEKKIKKEKIDNVSIRSFSKKADIFFSMSLVWSLFFLYLAFIFVIIISVTDERASSSMDIAFSLQFGVDGFSSQLSLRSKITQALYLHFVTIQLEQWQRLHCNHLCLRRLTDNL